MSVGTGLFVASGKALESGGPASLLICYSLIGMMLYCTVHALGEMAVLFPVAGSFSAYSTRFLDPAWGFAMGWVRSYHISGKIARSTDIDRTMLCNGSLFFHWRLLLLPSLSTSGTTRDTIMPSSSPYSSWLSYPLTCSASRATVKQSSSSPLSRLLLSSDTCEQSTWIT